MKSGISKRYPKNLINQINVVPYIDVMLVLLVIFMITAPLMNPGVIDLPSISNSSLPPVRPLEILLKKNEKLAFIDRNLSSAQRIIEKEKLIEIILEKQKNNPNQPVVISADKNIRYGRVMDVMDLLQRNNVRRVGLLAVPKK